MKAWVWTLILFSISSEIQDTRLSELQLPYFEMGIMNPFITAFKLNKITQ